VHTAEYLDQLIREGKIKPTKRVPLKITYHDPCYLGRLGELIFPGRVKKRRSRTKSWCMNRAGSLYGVNGVYEAPRNVLKSIPE